VTNRNRPQKENAIMGERKDYGYAKSKYLRAEDLVGKTVRVVFDKGLKPVLSFENKQKTLPVNASNFDTLAAAISPRTQDWVGHTITLKGEKVRFKGQLVDSIKVSVPAQTKPKEPKQTKTDDFDDGIPDFAA
jgi:hypothetical protein